MGKGVWRICLPLLLVFSLASISYGFENKVKIGEDGKPLHNI
jgi:hypothetical protein